MAKQVATESKPLAVSIERASQLLGISRNLAYSMAKTGELPTVKMGQRRMVVPINALERLLLQEQ